MSPLAFFTMVQDLCSCRALERDKRRRQEDRFLDSYSKSQRHDVWDRKADQHTFPSVDNWSWLIFMKDDKQRAHTEMQQFVVQALEHLKLRRPTLS
jgi:hypothetical protein